MFYIKGISHKKLILPRDLNYLLIIQLIYELFKICQNKKFSKENVMFLTNYILQVRLRMRVSYENSEIVIKKFFI